MAFDRLQDARVRAAVFNWLSIQVDAHGDVLPRTLLEEGAVFEGHRVPLRGPQGIFKPRSASSQASGHKSQPSGLRFLLRDIAACEVEAYLSAGMGKDVGITEQRTVAGTLAPEGEIVCLGAFPRNRGAERMGWEREYRV